MNEVAGLSTEKVSVTIMGKPYLVPKDKLLYLFQDLEMLRTRNKFCWRGECKNCAISFRENSGSPVIITERACQTTATAGLCVINMPDEFYITR